MMLRQNMDELFHMPLPADEIACAHACVCNLDKSSWAPEDWYVRLLGTFSRCLTFSQDP
jgi:hypothetical protein